MSKTRDKFLALRDDLNRVLIDRDQAITNAILALVTGEHFLQLGPPGTGKSLLVRALHKRLDKGSLQYFEKLMSQFTVPEELVGPIDLIRLADHGEYRRVSKGSITEADLVYLTEVFKANSPILNTLLAMMNERVTYEVGLDPQTVPLLSLFGDSNETPQDDSLKALDDRFLLRQIIHDIDDEADFIRLLTEAGSEDVPQVSLTMKDLRTAQKEVSQIKGTKDVLQALVTLWNALRADGLRASARRWSKSLAVIKASAWFAGETQTQLDDLAALCFTLWLDPKEQPAVERHVLAVANPLALRAVEIEDQARELMGGMPDMRTSDLDGAANVLQNICQQLNDMRTTLKEAIADSRARDKTQAEAALLTVNTLHRTVATELAKHMRTLGLTVETGG